MSILDNIPEEKRKLYIGGGIAAVCFVLAITAYVALSGDDSNSPEVQAAIEKSKALDQQIADQQPVVPDPPPRTARTRSAVKAGD